MKRILLTLTLLTGFALCAAAQERYGADHVLKLWDNATAPHSNGLTGPETEDDPFRIGNTTEAVLYIYKADPARDTGLAVVICPGGGYRRLSVDTEGFLFGRWLAENGITAALLKYRMPNGHPEVPLEDAVQALRVLAGQEAGATGFTADKVGIAGFSAGGHLAAYASTMGDFRPAFSILFYPVITGEEGRCHRGSFDQLLGQGRTTEQTAFYSLERQVDSLTPPAILLLSDDDRVVPPVSSTRYYDALKEQGRRASMHIYPSGGHGWGIKKSFAYKAEWQQALLEWLENLK